MIASHSQKPLERVQKILDFIKLKYEQNPGQESFSVNSGELSLGDPLLQDWNLLKIAFEEIVNESEKNIQIEFREGLPQDHTAIKYTLYESLIWFYVVDHNKFDEYRNKIIKRIEEEKGAVNFILDEIGLFYPVGASDDMKHSFRPSSLRYRLLYLLAQSRDFITTQNLAEELSVSPDDVRGAIEEIRTIVSRKMNLSRESIFENNYSGTGYRVVNVSINS